MRILSIIIICIIVIVVIGIIVILSSNESLRVGASMRVRVTVPDFEKKLIDEINSARNDPRGYVEQIYKRRDQYNRESIEETIEFLNNVKLCQGNLRPNVILSSLSQDWTNKQEKGDVGHGDFTSRFKNIRYSSIAENLSYGYTDPSDIVSALIIDEGIPDKGHRKNIFTCDFTDIGVSFGNHVRYGFMTGMIFGKNISAK